MTRLFVYVGAIAALALSSTTLWAEGALLNRATSPCVGLLYSASQQEAGPLLTAKKYLKHLRSRSKYAFEEFQMYEKYIQQDNAAGVHYITEAKERLEHLLFFSRGKAFVAGQESLTDSYDTPRTMFVMDHQGALFVGDLKTQFFHHSSFLAGGPVAAAGNLRIDKGKIIWIDNSSGHYFSGDQYTKAEKALALSNTIKALRDLHGVDISEIEVRFVTAFFGDPKLFNDGNEFLEYAESLQILH